MKPIRRGAINICGASTGRRVDFFTLDGKKVLEIAAETANCIKGTDLVFANLYISSTGGPLRRTRAPPYTT